MSYNGYNRDSTRDQRLISHMRRFIGENVLIFTTSGGPSGSGFEGILLSVNCDFVRLLTEKGSPPTCPISDICTHLHGSGLGPMYPGFRTGSICDIPFDKIVNFTHNAI